MADDLHALHVLWLQLLWKSGSRLFQKPHGLRKGRVHREEVHPWIHVPEAEGAGKILGPGGGNGIQILFLCLCKEPQGRHRDLLRPVCKGQRLQLFLVSRQKLCCHFRILCHQGRLVPVGDIDACGGFRMEAHDRICALFIFCAGI